MSKNTKQMILVQENLEESRQLGNQIKESMNNYIPEESEDILNKVLDRRDYQKAKLLIGKKVKMSMNAFVSNHITGELQLLMINNGFDVHQRTLLSFTALHYAKSDKVVEALIEKGVDISDINVLGQTALCGADKADVAKALIKAGIKVDRRDNNGQTALFGANAEVTKVLVENGADLNIKDRDGNTPIMHINGRETFDILVKNGARVDVINEEGMNIFMLMHCENLNIEYCLANGVDINHKDRSGNNVLYFLSEYNGKEMLFAQFLIEKGIDYQSVFEELPEILQNYIIMREEKRELNEKLKCKADNKKIIRF